MSTVRNESGFTLIETIIYVAIVGIAMSSFIAFGLSISFSRSKTYAVQEVQANARMLMDVMVQKLRQAQAVTSPDAGLDNDIMVLNMPGAEPDLSFSLVDGIVFLTEGVGESLPLVSDRTEVTNLRFTNLSASGGLASLRLEFDIRYRNAGSLDYAFADTYSTLVTSRY